MSKTAAKTKKLTPSQVRTRIVSALLALGYSVAEFAREYGHNKAWLRFRGKPAGKTAKALLARVSKEIAARGVAVTSTAEPDRWGEFHVRGLGFHLTLNQEADTGNRGGAFVETWKVRSGGAEILRGLVDEIGALS